MNQRLAPDGKTIFFSATNNYKAYMYSCSIDGSNLKTLLIQNASGGAGPDIEVAGAY